MMLDMRRTFDEIVLPHSGPERAEAILDNPFYRTISRRFAGTQEYMAMEKLGQLPATASGTSSSSTRRRRGRRWTSSTPRSGWVGFLDGRMIRLLWRPAGGIGRPRCRRRFGLRHEGAVHDPRRADARRRVGVRAALDTMFGGFRETATAPTSCCERRGTAFVVVAAPEPDALREASYFVDRLSAERCRWPG